MGTIDPSPHAAGVEVRTRYGPDDEDAFYAARKELIGAYEADTNPAGGDTFAATAMLDWKWGYGDGRIVHWTGTDLEELLLDWFPSKVTLDRDDVPLVPGQIGDFLSYLDGRNLLAGDPLKRLHVTLDALAPQFEDAMSQERAYGLAKTLALAMQADGVDLTDPGALARWTDEFNARPLEDRDDLVGRFSPAPIPVGPLPPIDLPPTDQLEAAAAGSSALSRLTAFTRFFDRPRKLTQKGQITLADGKQLAALLGLAREFDPKVRDKVFRTRSTTEMPGLTRTFRWSREAGLVKVRHGSLSATKRGRALGRQPTDDWFLAFETLVRGGVVYAHHGQWVEGPWWSDAYEELLAVLPELLYRRGGVERSVLHSFAADLLGAYEPRELGGSFFNPRRWIADDVERLVLRPTIELGAVTVVDGKASLTPLGLWATNRILRAGGEYAPIRGELADATADELVRVCARLPLDGAEQEMRTWIAGRPETAARELADAARSSDAPLMAFHALGLAGSAAEAEVRSLLEVESLRPLAQLWLVRHGYDDSSSLPAGTLATVFVETLVLTLDDEGPDAMVEHLNSLGPAEEQVENVERLLVADHPRTADVLDAIGRHHPSKLVAKAARKTAFKRLGYLAAQR
jgi:hypothetical protein